MLIGYAGMRAYYRRKKFSVDACVCLSGHCQLAFGLLAS